MFGKMMYYDKKTIDEYKSIINGKPQLHIEEYEVSNDKGASLDIKALSASAKANKKYVAKVVESLLYDCSEFEKSLYARDDFFDFTASNDFDFQTVPRGSIIKMNAYLEIPEDFDIVKMIDKFKPLVMDSIEADPGDQTTKTLLEAFFGNAKATKIPIIGDFGYNLFCSKILQEHLISEYEDFEELDEEVTVLARVSSGIISSKKPFFDPLKDFIKMNRMMRRNMNDEDNQFKAISVEKDYRTADILAIYK